MTGFRKREREIEKDARLFSLVRPAREKRPIFYLRSQPDEGIEIRGSDIPRERSRRLQPVG